MRPFLALVVLLFFCFGNILQAQDDSTSLTFFNQVMVFDGDKKFGPTNVQVSEGIIADIGDEIIASEGSTVIDGKGKLLMPGMIDSHTHTFFPAHLIQAAEFGVTTELDMMSMPSMAASLREARDKVEARNRADYFSAGAAVTVQRGHGTQFGFEVPTLDAVEDTKQFVKDRIEEGSDFIKIIVEDGSAYGGSIPTLSADKVAAAIKATKEHEKLAVVHVGNATGGALVVEMGPDGLVHLFADELATDEWVAQVKDKGVFVVPTAAVVSNSVGSNSTKTISENENLALLLKKIDLSGLSTTFPQRPGSKGSWETLKKNILKLHESGVSILAGTDAPNPGTVHGASMHHELHLLVEAGLSPIDALKAATAAPADAFQLNDRGRIATGLRADLVLVSGDPTISISDLHKIEGIWKAGYSIDLSPRLAQVAEEKLADSMLDSGETKLIDDFEEDAPRARFGAGWSISTDGMMGGESVAEMKVVEGGADGSSGAMEISGITQSQQPAFAGVMFSPGDMMMAPSDLSANKSVSFWTKGPSKTLAVMLFTQKGGMQPAMQLFTTNEEWTQYRFSFADFNGSDGGDVVGIWFGTNSPGEFNFQIDQLELR